MSICEAGWLGVRVNVGAKHDWSSEIHRPCAREAVTAVTSGCVHEHVETWKVCTPCQQALLHRAEREQPVCPFCHPDHLCRVLLSVPAEVTP